MDTIQLLESKTFPAYELLLIAYLHMIFQKLYVLYQSMDSIQNKPFEEHIALYRHMASYIYENYMDRLSIDDLADVVHISRNKCYHLFKKYTQQSPMEFVNRYRLEVSTNLLAYTMNSLASIAAACGFCHQSLLWQIVSASIRYDTIGISQVPSTSTGALTRFLFVGLKNYSDQSFSSYYP